jgi:hypothetical protein
VLVQLALVTDRYITAWDREWFKRCRRAWDLGSHSRRDLEPNGAHPPERSIAIRRALDVYYFPGMWDWQPTIVRPLVLEAFRGAMGPSEDEVGQRILERYFEWAPSVDRFCPMQVSAELIVEIPDPAKPDGALTDPAGAGVHYKDRIDAAVMDDQGFYWIIHHRLVEGDWVDVDLLTLGPRLLAACWAAEVFYLAPVAGVILNELRLAPDTGAVQPGPDSPRRRELEMKRGSILQSRHRPQLARAGLEPVAVKTFQQTTDWFRRTHVPLRRELIAAQARVLADELSEMVAEGPATYPHPSPQHCPTCAFRAPCLAMQDGRDAEPMLASGYRRRRPRADEPRIGRGFGFILPAPELRSRKTRPEATQLTS